MMDKYHVIDTPMRPRRWKVESIKFPGCNNSWTEYYEFKEAAETECFRRNSQWQLVVNMKDKGEFDTFEQAFRVLFDVVTKSPESIVFPACWIKYRGEVIGFDKCREQAYEEGILVGNGELAPPKSSNAASAMATSANEDQTNPQMS